MPKDRKGHTFTGVDISHCQKIVVALNKTIRIMREINDVIEEHNGWPDAFSVSDQQCMSCASQAIECVFFNQKNSPDNNT